MDEARRRAITTFLYGSVGLLATVAGLYVLSSGKSTDSPRGESSPSNVVSTSPVGSNVIVQPTGPSEISVRVVYFGMPLAVTGTKKETVELNSPAMLSDLKGAIVELHPNLKSMLPSMLFLVDGVSAITNVQLEDDVEVDVLPLSAGG